MLKQNVYHTGLYIREVLVLCLQPVLVLTSSMSQAFTLFMWQRDGIFRW